MRKKSPGLPLRNASQYCLMLVALSFVKSVLAGQAILFDSPYLVGYRDAAGLSGFYSATDGQTSCTFLFFEPEQEAGPAKRADYSVKKITTFVPSDRSFAFSDRNKAFDIDGRLYAKEEGWVIRTSKPQAGCGNAEGVFEFGPPDIRAERYAILKRIPALGIRMVGEKTPCYDFRGGNFVRRKGFLLKWDGVVVLRARGTFSYVRYSDPRSNGDGRVTTGWVHSADLVDPFPRPTERSGKN